MKTTILAAALATCLAGPALAQSNVLMYGIADIGLMKQTGQNLKVASGIAEGSRLGIKGNEELGGGYKAIFNLEARVEFDTGSQQVGVLSDEQGLFLTRGMGALPAPVLQAIRAALQVRGEPVVNQENALFDRTAMVGLITPFGALLFGRMYTPAYEVFAASDVFETGTAGTWGGITGGTAGFTSFGADIRSSKSLQYRFVTAQGVGGSLMYGGPGSGYLNRYHQFEGAALTYKAHGWDIGIGHNRGYAEDNALSLVTSNVGGSYEIGRFKLFAGYLRQRNRHSVLLREYIAGYDARIGPVLAPLGTALAGALRNVFVTNISTNSQTDSDSVQIGLHYRIGAGRLMASVAHQNDRTSSNSDANLYAIGYDYKLSRRTDIYTVYGQINNRNEAQYIPGTAGAPGGFLRTPGGTGRGLQIGIRHRF